jgi:hypothetical protein
MLATIANARRVGVEVSIEAVTPIEVWRAWDDRLREWAEEE